MKKLLLIISGFIIVGVFSSCANKNGKDADKKDDASKLENHVTSNTTMLSEKQIKTIGIELGDIEEKQLTASLKTNGVLKVPNQNKASISSVYSGIIKSLLVQPGNTVSKGQTIAIISNPEFIRIQEEFVGIKSKMILAEQEYNRQKELNAGNAGALKNLQAAETELKTITSRNASLAEQLRLMGINPETLADKHFVSVLSIRTPITGVVSNVMVQMGSYINVNTTVAEIVDNSQLHLDLFVYEKDLPKLKNNQTIHFTLTNNPGKEYDALIYSLGSSFEGESKAVTVHAMVKSNKTGLIDGMNVTAVISLEKNTVPAVPSAAIVTYQGQDYIFIQSEKHSANETKGKDQPKGGDIEFEKVPVAKGTTDVGFTEITPLKEIHPGSKVVTKGAFFVLAKMTNSGEDE